MTAIAQDVFTREKVTLTWHERPGGPTVTADCWFEPQAIRHVVEKHMNATEPWGRMLKASVKDALSTAIATRCVPAAADCRHFVEAVGGQLQRSAAEPVLCRYLETEFHWLDRSGRLHPVLGRLPKQEKILFILPAGAVGFVGVDRPWTEGTLSAAFLTAFFPRQTGWVAAKRAAATNVERYVLRWADQPHRTGGRLLPEPPEGVREEDRETGAVTQREYFRFITPETWGFELRSDGCEVWQGPRAGYFSSR